MNEFTRSYIVKNLKIVQTNGQKIKDILTNTWKYAAGTNFTCLGKPFCQNDNHLQTNLADFANFPKHISRGNMSLVPRPTKTTKVGNLPSLNNLDEKTNCTEG